MHRRDFGHFVLAGLLVLCEALPALASNSPRHHSREEARQRRLAYVRDFCWEIFGPTLAIAVLGLALYWLEPKESRRKPDRPKPLPRLRYRSH